MKREAKAWWRDAMLALLKRHPDETTAELTKALAVTCAREAVPEHIWCEMRRPAVSGVLRQLESAGPAVRTGTKRNARVGRNEPRWSAIDSESVPDDFPVYALEQVHAAVPSRPLVPTLSRLEPSPVESQALIDRLSGMLERHRGELDGFMKRVREVMEQGDD
jgi:hypothetical protein